MATTINTLTEYLKQEDPVKNVKVIVGENDVRRITKIKVGNEDYTLVNLVTDVKDKKHLVEGVEYLLIGSEGYLHTVDSDGNAKSKSVFYFEPNKMAKGGEVMAEMKGKSMDERKQALINRIKKHNWSRKPITEDMGIVKVHSEMYGIGKSTVAALFNEHQAPANGRKMEQGGEIDDNFGVFSMFKYYKVPNENLWAIQECNDNFEDGYGAKCIVIKNKKSEAEAKKEVSELNSKEVERMFDYYSSVVSDYDSGVAHKRRYHIMYESMSGKEFLVHSTDNENEIEKLLKLAKQELNKDGAEYDIWVVDTASGNKMAKGGSTTDPETQKKIKGLEAVIANKNIDQKFRDKAKVELDRIMADVEKVEAKVEKAVEKAVKPTTKPQRKAAPKKKPMPKAPEKKIKDIDLAVAKAVEPKGGAARRAKVVSKPKAKVEPEKPKETPKRTKKTITSTKRKKAAATETPKRKKKVITSAKRKKAAMVDVTTSKRGLAADKKREALPVGKRTSAAGNVYYEYRRNRADRNAKRKFAKGGEVDNIKVGDKVIEKGKPEKIYSVTSVFKKENGEKAYNVKHNGKFEGFISDGYIQKIN